MIRDLWPVFRAVIREGVSHDRGQGEIPSEEWAVGISELDERRFGFGAGALGRPGGDEEEVVESGFHLRPKFWRRGLATEAAQAAIGYAFATYHPKKLAAGHHPENLSSKKLIEKLGFKYSHEEPFAELGTDIPYYMLERVEDEKK